VNRWLALLIAVVGGAALGYGLLLIFLNALAWLGFGVVDGPALPAWTDYPLTVALIGSGLVCWAFCSWIIWSQLRARPSDPPAAG
jgi:hypothetical protein